MFKNTTTIILLFFCLLVRADTNVQEQHAFSPNQTSASLLIQYAERLTRDAAPTHRAEAEKKYLLLYDVYIKARSYALMNKVFFVLSLIFGLAVLLWPSFAIIFKSNLSKWEWIQSATVQTTVTAIAALMFAFYSDYKDKQTYAETLMRYTLFSELPVSELSVKVSEELARVDRGFSFNSILGEKGKSDASKPASAQ